MAFRAFRRPWRIILTFLTLGLVLFAGINALILLSTQNLILPSMDRLSPADAILIPGASVYGTSVVSSVLADRLKEGIAVYQAKKAPKVIVSGDNGRPDYNEVAVMRQYLLASGVPEADIVMDHAGFDTYDSLYRARDIFGVHSLIIVTQDFHLPRALYIGKSLGLSVQGIAALSEKYRFSTRLHNSLREPFARIKAFADVWSGAMPKFLGKRIPLGG